KDVVWVPTPQALVDMMLDVAKVTKNDFLMDLGSGDGRTVITAARRGVQAMGVEYNPDMVELAKRNAAKAGVSDRARFVKADLFETDFSKATVITMFLLNDINMRLRPKILDLKPGTRIVSNTFRMGDWEPDQEVVVSKDCSSYCTAYYWMVPAKVAGRWTMADGTLVLKQEFQKLSGSLSAGGREHALTNARMTGAAIAFTAGGRRYTGTVSGNSMEGSAGGSRWKAVRAGS
ncbi:MAG: cyclopropane-fatty-acyl-phospholipid synthase family protein, partial [Burkholderiales bacterium]